MGMEVVGDDTNERKIVEVRKGVRRGKYNKNPILKETIQKVFSGSKTVPDEVGTNPFANTLEGVFKEDLEKVKLKKGEEVYQEALNLFQTVDKNGASLILEAALSIVKSNSTKFQRSPHSEPEEYCEEIQCFIMDSFRRAWNGVHFKSQCYKIFDVKLRDVVSFRFCRKVFSALEQMAPHAINERLNHSPTAGSSIRQGAKIALGGPEQQIMVFANDVDGNDHPITQPVAPVSNEPIEEGIDWTYSHSDRWEGVIRYSGQHDDSDNDGHPICIDLTNEKEQQLSRSGAVESDRHITVDTIENQLKLIMCDTIRKNIDVAKETLKGALRERFLTVSQQSMAESNAGDLFIEIICGSEVMINFFVSLAKELWNGSNTYLGKIQCDQNEKNRVIRKFGTDYKMIKNESRQIFNKQFSQDILTQVLSESDFSKIEFYQRLTETAKLYVLSANKLQDALVEGVCCTVLQVAQGYVPTTVSDSHDGAQLQSQSGTKHPVGNGDVGNSPSAKLQKTINDQYGAETALLDLSRGAECLTVSSGSGDVFGQVIDTGSQRALKNRVTSSHVLTHKHLMSGGAARIRCNGSDQYNDVQSGLSQSGQPHGPKTAPLELSWGGTKSYLTHKDTGSAKCSSSREEIPSLLRLNCQANLKRKTGGNKPTFRVTPDNTAAPSAFIKNAQLTALQRFSQDHIGHN